MTGDQAAVRARSDLFDRSFHGRQEWLGSNLLTSKEALGEVDQSRPCLITALFLVGLNRPSTAERAFEISVNEA